METFKTNWNLSWPSGNFQGHLEPFLIVLLDFLLKLCVNFTEYLETFQALNLVSFQCSYDPMKDFTVIMCLVVISYKISNKIYSIFHLESFCTKSLLPGKFLSFPLLPQAHLLHNSYFASNKKRPNRPANFVGPYYTDMAPVQFFQRTCVFKTFDQTSILNKASRGWCHRR